MLADAWANALLVAGPGEGLAMAQRMGLEALFLMRRPQGLVAMGSGAVRLMNRASCRARRVTNRLVCS